MEAITVHKREPRRSKSSSLPVSQLSYFRAIWREVESDAEQKWTSITCEMDKEVTSHIEEMAAQWHREVESRYQVSTILLRLGVNTPDHSQLFRRLKRRVSNLTPHVVRLRSTECPNMRAVMHQLTRRLFPKSSTCLPTPLRLTFHSIVTWYNQNERDGHPIVILLEDSESLSPKLLQDFVSVNSVHTIDLPIIFVWGLASHPAVLHGLLGSLAFSRLRVKEVKGPSAVVVRRRVLEPLLLPSPRCPLGIGPRVRNFLIDTFTHIDSSAANFLRRLCLCVLEHSLRSSTKKLKNFASDAESKTAPRKVHLLLRTSEWLSKLLRTELRYAALSKEGMAKSEQFQDALNQWLRLPVENLVDDVREKTTEEDKEMVNDIKLAVEEVEAQDADTAAAAQTAIRSGKMSLQQLKARLKAINMEKRRPADQLRQRLRRSVIEFAERYCPALDCHLPTFDDLETVKGMLNPAQRSDLHIALSMPSVYLRGDRIDTNEIKSLSSRLPDLSILYKLHLECPHFINLYDWMQAFSEILGEKCDTRGVPPASVQARFTLGVSELQFLGLVKPTARKTDHVVRLTWGSC